MPFHGLPGATSRLEWWLRLVRVTLPGSIRARCHRGILLTALFDGLKNESVKQRRHFVQGSCRSQHTQGLTVQPSTYCEKHHPARRNATHGTARPCPAPARPSGSGSGPGTIILRPSLSVGPRAAGRFAIRRFTAMKKDWCAGKGQTEAPAHRRCLGLFDMRTRNNRTPPQGTKALKGKVQQS